MFFALGYWTIHKANILEYFGGSSQKHPNNHVIPGLVECRHPFIANNPVGSNIELTSHTLVGRNFGARVVLGWNIYGGELLRLVLDA